MKSVREKIADNDYQTKVSYDIEDIPITDDMTVKQAREIREGRKERKAEQRRLYYVDQARLDAEFHRDLAFECGLSQHPKEALLFRLAWEHGHSGSCTEVLYYYEEFSELLS